MSMGKDLKKITLINKYKNPVQNLAIYGNKIAMNNMEIDCLSIIYQFISYIEKRVCLYEVISLIRIHESLRFKEIIWVCHSFEFKIVSCWILKEHGKLFPR